MTMKELKEKIRFVLKGIDSEDLTTAEKQILKLVEKTKIKRGG